MKKLLTDRLTGLVFLLLLGAGAAQAQAPTWQWAVSVGEGETEATAVDATGNVVVTGSFLGTIAFGSFQLTSVGSYDVFVAKFTPMGNCLWAVQGGGSDDDHGYNLAVDSGGNVYVTGKYHGLATFGNTTLSTGNFANVVVAKLSAAGVWQWAASADAGTTARGMGVALDGGGNVYVTGGFSSPTARFGSTTLTRSPTYVNGFVARLSPAGSWQWATQISGSNGGGYIRSDTAGNLYMAGHFLSSTATFGTITLSISGGNCFVAKLNASTGAWQWSINGGGSSGGLGRGLGLDNGGNVYVTGSFRGSTATFGSTTLTGTGDLNLFVARMSPAGTWQWAVGATGAGPNNQERSNLSTDTSGNIYVAGSFNSDQITVGTTTLFNAVPGSSVADAFVAKLTPAGTWQWALRVGGPGYEGCTGVVADQTNIYVCGSYNSPVIAFGTTTLSYAGNSTAGFIAGLRAPAVGVARETTAALLCLSPNPAHETVQLTGAPGPTATLLDALGRTVRTVPLTAGAATLDVADLTAGLYIVRAGSATRRLVVER